MAKPTVTLHRCADCKNVTPVLDKENQFSLKGEPLIGTCPHWRESRSLLLSQLIKCDHFKPKNRCPRMK